MKRSRTTRKPNHRPDHARRDALRVSLALVFILFASMASRDHETPEKILESRAVATTSKEERAPKQRFALPAILKRLTGINGSI